MAGVQNFIASMSKAKGFARLTRYEVEIHGPSRVIYSPDKPLSCGARVWIETKSEVDIK